MRLAMNEAWGGNYTVKDLGALITAAGIQMASLPYKTSTSTQSEFVGSVGDIKTVKQRRQVFENATIKEYTNQGTVRQVADKYYHYNANTGRWTDVNAISKQAKRLMGIDVDYYSLEE